MVNARACVRVRVRIMFNSRAWVRFRVRAGAKARVLLVLGLG